MRYFCTKDCPDLCEFDIQKDENGKVSFKAIPKAYNKTPFVCTKLKDYYEREVTNLSSYILTDGHHSDCQHKVAIKAFYDLLETYKNKSKINNNPKKILYIRGSGSLGYMMKYWDLLMSHYENCSFINGDPCVTTGSDAHKKDFGICANPSQAKLENVDNIIIFGKNAHDTSIHFYAYLKQLKKAGKTIVYIDPIKTSTANIADTFIRINPGTDGFLSAGLLKLMGKTDAIDIDKAIEVTGISISDFEYLQQLIEAGKTAFVTGYGLQRYVNGMNTVQWINRLAVYTGNEDVLYFGRGSKDKFEKLKVKANSYIQVEQIIDHLESNTFDLVIIIAANPVITYPDSNRWMKALEKITTVIVDTNETATSKYADIFIKVGGMFSQEDVQGSYFFQEESVRKRFNNQLSDIDVVKQLSQLANIDLRIRNIDELKPVKDVPQRQFNDIHIPLTPPNDHNNKFRLITNSTYLYLNSQILDKHLDKHNVIYISSDDATKYELKDNDNIKLKNSTGEIESRIKISDMVAKGVLLVYKNRLSAKGWTNMLTSNIATDSNTGLAYYDTFVDLKKIY